MIQNQRSDEKKKGSLTGEKGREELRIEWNHAR